MATIPSRSKNQFSVSIGKNWHSEISPIPKWLEKDRFNAVYIFAGEARQQEFNQYLSSFSARIGTIEQEIKSIKTMLSAVLKQLAEFGEPIEIIDTSREKAKELIKNYFEAHHGKILTYSDLFEALHIDMPLIIELCDELAKEGEIAEAPRPS